MLSRAGLLLVGMILGLMAACAEACPFCQAVQMTYCEEVQSNDLAILVKLIDKKTPAEGLPASDAPLEKSVFEVQKVLKGDDSVKPGQKVETIYFGEAKVGDQFLIMGIEPPDVTWATPMPISAPTLKYLEGALTQSKEGSGRLGYFLPFLEDKEEAIRRDAYDEFAKAPYAQLKELKAQLPHDSLVKWIKDPETTASRRRLYLVMLSVCGNRNDAQMMEQMLQATDTNQKLALDALIGSYVTLRGPEGMPLIIKTFLDNSSAEYTETWNAIQALRILGQEEIVPRETVLVGLRCVLDRPKLADTVIPDLARWEDWSVMARLVELFKSPNKELAFVRVPVINYLRVCPLPEAKQYLDECATLDPKAMKQAQTFYPSLAPAAKNAGQRDPKPTAPPGA